VINSIGKISIKKGEIGILKNKNNIMNQDKEYDIVLLGATGFTGQIIAKYLDEHIGREEARFAIAGRSEAKLKAIKEGLTNTKPNIILCDIDDIPSIDALTSRAKIVLNTIGPFNWYGRYVIASCIRNHCHYLDITGEPSFVAESYINYNQLAKDNEVCVVNCCGFDSIPADYVAYLAAQNLPIDEPKVLRSYVKTNATFSGGTLTTAINALHLEVKNEAIKIPRWPRHPDTPRAVRKIHKISEVGGWGIPMPVVDPHIVKRSIATMPAHYGEATAYAQFFVRSTFGKVVKTILPIAVASFLVRFEYYRKKLLKKFPQGTGPSEERRKKSRFEITCIGEARSKKVMVSMSGGDPGYNETAKMMSEAAFTLLDRIRVESLQAGVNTPVQAFGEGLIDRLKAKGIKFELEVLN
jgi:short subunit dehydrogenase-like uncharacterized protein